MAEFSVTLNASSNGTINTEDSFVELSSTASMLQIKRVRVRFGDGTATEVDHQFRIRMVRKSAAGAGGVAGTKVKIDIMSPAAAATCNVKTGTTNFTTGTVTDQLDIIIMNTRGIFEWIPRDQEELISTDGTATTIFSVLLQSPVATEKYQVSVYWAEN